MSRTLKDHYRPLFCNSDFYQKHQNVFDSWKHKFAEFPDFLKVQAWAIGLTCLRRPDDWFGGLRKIPLVDLTEINEKILCYTRSFSIDSIFNESPILLTKKIEPHLSIFDFLNICKIKPLPDSCLRALCHLTTQKYPLKIIDYVPTPEELLEIQLTQKRIITFHENFEEWPQKLYGERDFLSFVIHDLVHADHFFKDDQNKIGQLGFYRLIQKIWNTTSLQELLSNQNFKTGFEYIISDMNSHPVHLFKTLHARLLHSTSSDQTHSIWHNWTLIWVDEINEPQEYVTALQKINTQLFCDKEAITLQGLCIAMGHKMALAEHKPHLVL